MAAAEGDKPAENLPAKAAAGPAPAADETAPTDGLPFWLDYGVPVGSGAVFLFILWVLAMAWLWHL